MSTGIPLIFEPELADQLAQLPVLEIPKGTVVLKEEAYIKEIPLVIKGDIKVRKLDESGKELTFYHILPGESCILSITSCLVNKQSKAEAVALEDSRVIVVSASLVKQWMDDYKSWRTFVLELYYQRMDKLMQLIDGISFKQTDSRLYKKLKELQALHGQAVQITHQELANEIGTAREVTSRLLKQMEKQGLIRLERGSIEFLVGL